MNSPSLPTDQIKIQTVGAFMKGGAWSWYQQRKRTMEVSCTPDDWKAFQSALVDRFTDQMERRKDFQRMRDLE